MPLYKKVLKEQELLWKHTVFKYDDIWKKIFAGMNVLS